MFFMDMNLGFSNYILCYLNLEYCILIKLIILQEFFLVLVELVREVVLESEKVLMIKCIF